MLSCGLFKSCTGFLNASSCFFINDPGKTVGKDRTSFFCPTDYRVPPGNIDCSFFQANGYIRKTFHSRSALYSFPVCEILEVGIVR
uniref:Uncharacterized protein n=1 Tax=Anguilla anguilla TaxID=7936 RepID=A0A0E9VG79_ANGAN